MTGFFSSFSLSAVNWMLIVLCALLIGMSKTGVPGVSMIVVPMLALIFGGKQSTGILLPILIMADVFAVVYYHRDAKWKHLLRALPWAFAGLLVALWIGNLVNDEQFKRIIAITVFISVALMIWKDYYYKKEFTPDKWWFAALMGIVGGFATMIGNVAGPIFAIYLLAMHLNKKSFIGTNAWFFFIINLSKFPLQMFVWKNINMNTLMVDILVFPAIAFGAWLGIFIVKRIPEKAYKWFVIVITVVSAFLILI
ncbi:MAG: sulfite exporter TauE/SafE family protein [Bacteroidia bacterium]|nr:sulfite exporter TauE/SafE family protein [Bacteroidia bacterium]